MSGSSYADEVTSNNGSVTYGNAPKRREGSKIPRRKDRSCKEVDRSACAMVLEGDTDNFDVSKLDCEEILSRRKRIWNLNNPKNSSKDDRKFSQSQSNKLGNRESSNTCPVVSRKESLPRDQREDCKQKRRDTPIDHDKKHRTKDAWNDGASVSKTASYFREVESQELQTGVYRPEDLNIPDRKSCFTNSKPSVPEMEMKRNFQPPDCAPVHITKSSSEIFEDTGNDYMEDTFEDSPSLDEPNEPEPYIVPPNNTAVEEPPIPVTIKSSIKFKGEPPPSNNVMANSRVEEPVMETPRNEEPRVNNDIEEPRQEEQVSVTSQSATYKCFLEKIHRASMSLAACDEVCQPSLSYIGKYNPKPCVDPCKQHTGHVARFKNNFTCVDPCKPFSGHVDPCVSSGAYVDPCKPQLRHTHTSPCKPNFARTDPCKSKVGSVDYPCKPKTERDGTNFGQQKHSQNQSMLRDLFSNNTGTTTEHASFSSQFHDMLKNQREDDKRLNDFKPQGWQSGYTSGSTMPGNVGDYHHQDFLNKKSKPAPRFDPGSTLVMKDAENDKAALEYFKRGLLEQIKHFLQTGKHVQVVDQACDYFAGEIFEIAGKLLTTGGMRTKYRTADTSSTMQTPSTFHGMQSQTNGTLLTMGDTRTNYHTTDASFAMPTSNTFHGMLSQTNGSSLTMGDTKSNYKKVDSSGVMQTPSSFKGALQSYGTLSTMGDTQTNYSTAESKSNYKKVDSTGVMQTPSSFKGAQTHATLLPMGDTQTTYRTPDASVKQHPSRSHGMQTQTSGISGDFRKYSTSAVPTIYSSDGLNRQDDKYKLKNHKRSCKDVGLVDYVSGEASSIKSKTKTGFSHPSNSMFNYTAYTVLSGEPHNKGGQSGDYCLEGLKLDKKKECIENEPESVQKWENTKEALKNLHGKLKMLNMATDDYTSETYENVYQREQDLKNLKEMLLKTIGHEANQDPVQKQREMDLEFMTEEIKNSNAMTLIKESRVIEQRLHNFLQKREGQTTAGGSGAVGPNKSMDNQLLTSRAKDGTSEKLNENNEGRKICTEAGGLEPFHRLRKGTRKTKGATRHGEIAGEKERELDKNTRSSTIASFATAVQDSKPSAGGINTLTHMAGRPDSQQLSDEFFLRFLQFHGLTFTQVQKEMDKRGYSLQPTKPAEVTKTPDGANWFFALLGSLEKLGIHRDEVHRLLHGDNLRVYGCRVEDVANVMFAELLDAFDRCSIQYKLQKYFLLYLGDRIDRKTHMSAFECERFVQIEKFRLFRRLVALEVPPWPKLYSRLRKKFLCSNCFTLCFLGEDEKEYDDSDDKDGETIASHNRLIQSLRDCASRDFKAPQTCTVAVNTDGMDRRPGLLGIPKKSSYGKITRAPSCDVKAKKLR